MATSGDFDPELLQLFDGYVHGVLSRRQFLDRAAAFAAAGTSAGAVLASLSPNYALAQQISPDDPAIRVSYKHYASDNGGGKMRGYYCRPALLQHRLPAVVVIHENRGLNPYIEDVARRLAIAGYVAFAPDALTPLGGYPGNDDDGRTLQRQRDRGEMQEDFAAAVQFLRGHPDCNGKVGSIGFCFGGGMSLYLAVRDPELSAAVAFYGRHPEASEAAKINAPLLIVHGELDTRINAGWPEFESALRSAERRAERYVYKDVHHGFHNDTTPRYDKVAAEQAWARSLAFFAEHLT